VARRDDREQLTAFPDVLTMIEAETAANSWRVIGPHGVLMNSVSPGFTRVVACLQASV
jgi:hypothetical protein